MASNPVPARPITRTPSPNAAMCAAVSGFVVTTTAWASRVASRTWSGVSSLASRMSARLPTCDSSRAVP